MPYATAADLVSQFGMEEIIQVSDRGIPRLVTAEMMEIAINGGDLTEFEAEEQAATSAALSLINSKILDAESTVNGFLASRYAVPLQVVPRLVLITLCDLVRYRLHDDNATEAIKTRYDDALKMLKCISKGEINLGVDVDGNKPTAKDVAVVESTTPVFGRDCSKGFI